MHIDTLVTMANDIAAFFASEDVEQAPQSVATHLSRYWDPRMRKQIVEYVQADGEGLSPVARGGVMLLAQTLSRASAR